MAVAILALQGAFIEHKKKLEARREHHAGKAFA